MNALDTNTLIYAHDPRDPAKQTIALLLITGLSNGVLLWQVACEYIAAARKLQPLGYSLQSAWKLVQDYQQLWLPALPNWDLHKHAEQLMSRHNLSLWDALIIGACIEAGVTRLYTEDLGGLSSIGGVSDVNPFTP